MMKVEEYFPTGHVLAQDPELIARAVRAIRARRLTEVELVFSPATNVVQIKRRSAK